jgi:hypothetical protein
MIVLRLALVLSTLSACTTTQAVGRLPLPCDVDSAESCQDATAKMLMCAWDGGWEPWAFGPAGSSRTVYIFDKPVYQNRVFLYVVRSLGSHDEVLLGQGYQSFGSCTEGEATFFLYQRGDSDGHQI